MASGNVLFPFADLCSAVALQVEPNIRFYPLKIIVGFRPIMERHIPIAMFKQVLKGLAGKKALIYSSYIKQLPTLVCSSQSKLLLTMTFSNVGQTCNKPVRQVTWLKIRWYSVVIASFTPPPLQSHSHIHKHPRTFPNRFSFVPESPSLMNTLSSFPQS